MRFFKRKTDDFDFAARRMCRTCGNSFQGRYCNQCGEKVIENYERTLPFIFGNFINAVTFLDNKFLKSLRMLVVRPGYMSKKVISGNRQSWMKPISLFFVGNLLYFLLPGFNTFNSTMRAQMNQNYGEWATQWINEKVEKLNISYEEYANLYTEASTDYAKLLLIILIFLFSIPLSLINYSKKRYYSDHLTLSIEFMSFVLFYTSIFFFFLLKVVILLGHQLGSDWQFLMRQEELIMLPVVIVSLVYFLIRSHRTFYEQKWWVAGIKTIVTIYLLTHVITMYRFILFCVTMLSINQ